MDRGLCVILAIFVSITIAKVVPKPTELTEPFVLTTIESSPYKASLQYYGSHQCGGTILNSRVVLSAAHCFCGQLKHYSIKYGSTDVNKGKTVKIARIDLHENYNKINGYNDIVLIHLAEDIEFGLNAQPIALAKKTPVPGTKAFALGWGLIPNEDANKIHKINVKIVDQSVCRNQYPNEITDSMLCAQINAQGRFTCQEDTGGPLVANNELVGIIRKGPECSIEPILYFGVNTAFYVDVAHLRQWIEDKIN